MPQTKYFIREYRDKDQEQAQRIYLKAHLAATETMPETIRHIYRTATKTEAGLGLTNIRDNYATAHNHFFVAAYGPEPEDITGFCALSKLNDQQAELKNLAVDPEYQGLGIAQLLMDTFEQEARQRGYRKAGLWTYSYLSIAMSIYKRRGWVEQEVEIPPGTFLELEPVYMTLDL